ncbi:MAG: four helix bundle protein [Chitinophagaceae bacterium]|nr:four helix bundle protein [Chitinophagaceae bacterium]
MAEPRKFDLEDRLVKFAILILEVCELLPATRSAGNLEHQLSRSGTSPALMYGEAQAAESRNDFIHKIRILLKELRETRIILRIVSEKPVIHNEKVRTALQECNELIGIFTKSIETANKNKVH